ncbi:hypothetical protein KSF_088980 [Reticulibacter mediterranei]|uniref:Uncharacterized protein n=1 Tax=Reticulibacter mediterranei TaxID=2778369 RepID=A0A8J3IY05_9CHLR|nr:hypothetical protein KSF_088980 [Reticulibacter mediterranei]
MFRAREGAIHRFPYAQIRSIGLEHPWLFSDYDPMTIFLTNGSFQEFACVGGSVHMTDLDKSPISASAA